MNGIYLDSNVLSHYLREIGLTYGQAAAVISVVETALPIRAFPRSLDIELGEDARLVCPVLPTASVPRVCQFKFEMPGIDPGEIGRVEIPPFDYASSEPLSVGIRLNFRAFELIKTATR
jgi:hypothetical protein